MLGQAGEWKWRCEKEWILEVWKVAPRIYYEIRNGMYMKEKGQG